MATYKKPKSAQKAKLRSNSGVPTNTADKKKSVTMQAPRIISNVQTISLCLVMIVKNEEDTMERCLTAVAPYIKYWVIVDTGSSDKTVEITKKTMESLGIPGELHERPWVNFEVNRTESLNLAKDKCDYRWIIDADDTFQVDKQGINPFAGLDTIPDSYQILYKLNALQYHRAQIVRSSQNWVYKGVLHEYLFLDEEGIEITQSPVPNCHVVADISPLKRAATLEEKYANDAVILEKALMDEPDNTRYMFYLAQSYRDSEQLDKSMEAYEKRISMGGWEEEVYYSMYMIAKMKEKLGHSTDEVIQAFSRAWEYRPARLEAVFHAMRKFREAGRHLISFAYGDVAIKTNGTGDILFIEPEIWQWRLLDEYSLAAYYIGNPEIALEKTNAIVSAPFFKSLHPDEQSRLLKNLDFYKKGAQAKSKKVQELNKKS
jgi:glycosyltransferase involved in cell wall biosynthesis